MDINVQCRKSGGGDVLGLLKENALILVMPNSRVGQGGGAIAPQDPVSVPTALTCLQFWH